MSEEWNSTLEAIFSGGLHHAYLLEGDAAIVGPRLRGFLENELGIKTAGNPDFWHLHFDVLTIDNARNLREMQANKSFGMDTQKIFLIEVATITAEAQNALLKILEEPTTGTYFFLMVRSRWLLLPTVRSRLQIVSMASTGNESDRVGVMSSREGSVSIEAFLKASAAERLALLEPILEEKDKSAALALVDGIIIHIHKIESPHRGAVLKELLHARQYLNDRVASLKLILEHVALTIPRLMPVL